MKATSTLFAVAALFATVFAQVETGAPAAVAAEVDTGYSSTCCSNLSTCNEDEIPCPHEHGHHNHHGHGQYINQNIAPFPTPVSECSCHNPVPECLHTCRQQHCQTCYWDEPCPTCDWKEPCPSCEWKKDPCPPYCQLYTTTATFEYPYTTLSATETCTMTLLSCENDDKKWEYDSYTQYPDHCEYNYPCHTPYAYGFAQPPRGTITATVVPIVHYEENKHDHHRKVAEPLPAEVQV